MHKDEKVFSLAFILSGLIAAVATAAPEDQRLQEVDISTATDCSFFADMIMEASPVLTQATKDNIPLSIEYIDKLRYTFGYYEQVCATAIATPGAMYAVCAEIPNNEWCRVRKVWWKDYLAPVDKVSR